MLPRFRRLIAEARKNGSPWVSLSETQLDAIAARLDATDIDEIIDALEQLSRDKDGLPDWDGDSRDDIARAQDLFTAILTRMASGYRAAIAARLDSSGPLTRLYLTVALGRP